MKSMILALTVMMVAPFAAQASEITLLPAVKLHIGDQDNHGNYWDGGPGATAAGGTNTTSGATNTGSRTAATIARARALKVVTTMDVIITNKKRQLKLAFLLLLVALKDQLRRTGRRVVKEIAIAVEILQLLRLRQPFFNNKTAH